MSFRRQAVLFALTWPLAHWASAQTPAPGAGPAERLATEAEERLQLVSLLKKQFEKPEAPLDVVPVVIQGRYAVVGWEQAGHGGRALLSKTHQHWQILVCGGHALRESGPLTQAGVPATEALALARRVRSAEAGLSPIKRKTLDSFGAVIRMDQAPHKS